MTDKLENISIYHCRICEHQFGIFYAWHEVDDETEPTMCPICYSQAIGFVKDVENIHI